MLKSPTIAKLIHFIWVGSEIPAKYVDNVKRFVLHNQPNGYSFYLWVDHDTPSIQGVEIKNIRTLEIQNQTQFDQEINNGAKADILRYEIVYQYGGMYSDIDVISLKPFDYVFEKAFLSHTFEPWNNLTNAVFGFPPRHPFLKMVLDCLPNTRSIPDVPHRTGPWFFTNCFLDFVDGRHLPWENVCTLNREISMIHQDLLIYPRRTTNKDRRVGYTLHLNDANWAVKPNRKAPRLSLCTTVKNRLCHLSQTLPQNIADAGSDTEFVVLDYTSDDGLGEWIKPFVTNGLVNYFRAENQTFWRNSHAKNVSTLASSGDIICNVDADNFITAGFTDYVIDFYANNSGVFTAPAATEGVTGRIAMKRTDFEMIGGYNEMYSFGWGCEDIDLIARAKAFGFPITYMDLRYLRQIAHNNEMRGQYAEIKDIWKSNEKSLKMMEEMLAARQFIANSGGPWGCCSLIKNYQEACNTKSAN